MRRVVHGWTWNGTPSPSAMYSTYYAYDGNNLQSISYSNNINQVYSYEYTDDGKIASETIGKYDTGETTEIHGYTYDAYGQLTEEVNSSLLGAGYAYDDRENLISVQRQTADGTETRVFTYGNPAWPDQLTAVNGSPLTYDAAGNRTSYNGWSYSWRAGRQLANMSNGTATMQFQYDSDGIRTQKTVNGITTQYTTLDGRITGQSDGTTVMQFIYTEEGTPFGMMVNGEPYLYVTNQQGDVTMVTDRSGLPLCSYTYDAWGNVLSITGEDTEIGELNPIRYRGYYQDVETGLYYLQSRYYDPTTMRFINADDPNVIQMGTEEKQELNLYVYCINDPVNCVDYNGQKALYWINNQVAASNWSIMHSVKTKIDFNCYGFAIGIYSGYQRWALYPGFKSGKRNDYTKYVSVNEIAKRVVADLRAMRRSARIVYSPYVQCSKSEYLIAIRVVTKSSGYDYHFMRRDSDGIWRFKGGWDAWVFELKRGLTPSNVSWDQYYVKVTG